ncbi:tetratricopeptide repeat-containing glycosyltransferase family protein [Azospirillum sp. SYSU D00513]|uniref:tetratricopeptide repeat-containing glycosyltransferase family protein n=1 Tax=Azospirillum sp. SYSU D00513 TaxID=2812561 RepID=UPI001A96C582|nr:tetratricopeptide repeat-containing glycosyltransferase family protein [Azospirillum sp. SYSU D00513]
MIIKAPPFPQPQTGPSLLETAQNRLQVGDVTQAEYCCRRFLPDAPANPEALHLLGLIAFQAGDTARALLAFGRAVAVRPDHVRAHANRAGALQRLGHHEAAHQACLRALALDPALPALQQNLGALLRELGRAEQALKAFRRSARLAPQNGAAFHALGNALRGMGRLDEAMEAYQRLISLHPAAATAHGNLGVMLQFQGRLVEASACYARALAIDPSYAEARSNLGLVQLLTGDLAAGWVNHAARWETGDRAASRRDFPLPAWNGAPLAGKKLLVWGELGVGDEILLAGMVPDLAERGIGCVLETAPRLVPLFARSFPDVEVVPRTAPPDPATGRAELAAHCALGDLGRRLRPDFDSFPRRPAYLAADPEKVRVLRARYRAEAGDNLLVGISWHSANPDHRDFKSAPLELWQPILELPGITFVDLQYGDRSAELGAVRRKFGVTILRDALIDPLADLDGFAAQVATLDLVISISNTTVHVAGALGIPVWTLLARQTGFLWCWFTEREDSPWYPSMRLYRQRTAGDWTPVLERVRGNLARLLAAR